MFGLVLSPKHKDMTTKTFSANEIYEAGKIWSIVKSEGLSYYQVVIFVNGVVPFRSDWLSKEGVIANFHITEQEFEDLLID